MKIDLKKWLESFNVKLNDLQLNDRVDMVMTQLLNGLSTEDSIEVMKTVNIKFNHELQSRMKHAIDEQTTISSYVNNH